MLPTLSIKCMNSQTRFGIPMPAARCDRGQPEEREMACKRKNSTKPKNCSTISAGPLPILTWAR